MNVPDSYPDNDTGWLDYLQDYDNALLLQMPFVPFWMQTVLGCMDLIGPETEADLERIIKRVLQLPTHEHLREIRAAVRDEIAAVRGPHYFQDRTPLGRKYGVIVNLLDGHIKQPFDDCEWAACFASYAMGCIDPDGTKEAIIGERILAALKEYSPPQNV